MMISFVHNCLPHSTTLSDHSVWQRDDGRYEVRVSLPDGRRSVYGETRKEVLAKARTLQQEAEQGTYIAPLKETIAEHFRQWVTLKRMTWEYGTYANNKIAVENHIIPALGSMRLQQLKTIHIQTLYANLQTKGLAASTIRRIHTTLRGALEYAVREGKLFKNPVNAVQCPKMEEKEIRYLTTEEIERLIKAARHHPLGCLFILAVATGMRRNELLALQWDDLDLERGMLQVKHSLAYHNVDGAGYSYATKTPKSRGSKRAILLPTFAIIALRNHSAQQSETRQKAKEWHDLGLVFPNIHGLHRCPPAMCQAYRLFLQNAGIADANFHAIRHGHATSLLEMGENPRVVQERLGHSDVRTTLAIYGHVAPTMQQQTITKLDARFGKELQARRGDEATTKKPVSQLGSKMES
jgi:integrase